MTENKPVKQSASRRGMTTSIYIWYENVVALRSLAKKKRMTKNELINKLISQENEKGKNISK